MRFFKKRQPKVVVRRPMRDDEAMDLVRRGVLRPDEAPMAVLRDMQRRALEREDA